MFAILNCRTLDRVVVAVVSVGDNVVVVTCASGRKVLEKRYKILQVEQSSHRKVGVTSSKILFLFVTWSRCVEIILDHKENVLEQNGITDIPLYWTKFSLGTVFTEFGTRLNASYCIRYNVYARSQCFTFVFLRLPWELQCPVLIVVAVSSTQSMKTSFLTKIQTNTFDVFATQVHARCFRRNVELLQEMAWKLFEQAHRTIVVFAWYSRCLMTVLVFSGKSCAKWT